MAKIDDPSVWTTWRTGPIPFPTQMRPLVPETLEAGPAIELDHKLTIVLPDRSQDEVHGKALQTVVGWIRHRVRKSQIVTAEKLAEKHQERHLLVLGTLTQNPLAQRILGSSAATFMRDIPPGGYRIQPVAHPWSKERRVVLALGADEEGAWRAAIVFCFGIRPGGIGQMERWPVKLPEATGWVPFEATCSERPSVIPASASKPPAPRIPFGVRTWSSPTPTLATYERMIRALKRYGLNSIVLTPGGWQDVRNPGEVCRRALDIAYDAGLFTILYVGNDAEAHRPAPLTEKHRAIVAAVKNHPGLLRWELYNQLTAELSAAERRMVREQTDWLHSVSDKPVGMEIVWGHDMGQPPAAKVALMRDLLSWGVRDIAHDYAPIGGWSDKHDLSLWERRINALHELNAQPWAVLQAHVPFEGPTLPTRAELRNQFWWCVAAGAQAFHFEVAYSFNYFSNRGLLTWTLDPCPDGRLEEVGELARITRSLEPILLKSRPVTKQEVEFLGVKLTKGDDKAVVRIRCLPGEILCLVFVSRDVNAATRVECSLGRLNASKAVDVVTGAAISVRAEEKTFVFELPPGGGACFGLQ